MEYLTLQPHSGFEATLRGLRAFWEHVFLGYILEGLVMESPHKDLGHTPPLSAVVLWNRHPDLVSSNRNHLCAHQHHFEKPTNE